jgi:hypothetical protein
MVFALSDSAGLEHAHINTGWASSSSSHSSSHGALPSPDRALLTIRHSMPPFGLQRCCG